MARELNHKFIIDSVSIISMNDYANISQVSFPSVTIMSDPSVHTYKVLRRELSLDE